MKPKPLSSLNHLTVPVAIVFPPALRVLRTRRLLSKSYDRWHYDVGELPTGCTNPSSTPDGRVASGSARLASRRHQRPASGALAQASGGGGADSGVASDPVGDRVGYEAGVIPHRHVTDPGEHAQLGTCDLSAVVRRTGRQRQDLVALGPREQHRRRDSVKVPRHDVGAAAKRADDLIDDLAAESTARHPERVGRREQLSVTHHITERQTPTPGSAHDALQLRS